MADSRLYSMYSLSLSLQPWYSHMDDEHLERNGVCIVYIWTTKMKQIESDRKKYDVYFSIFVVRLFFVLFSCFPISTLFHYSALAFTIMCLLFNLVFISKSARWKRCIEVFLYLLFRCFLRLSLNSFRRFVLDMYVCMYEYVQQTNTIYVSNPI